MLKSLRHTIFLRVYNIKYNVIKLYVEMIIHFTGHVVQQVQAEIKASQKERAAK